MSQKLQLKIWVRIKEIVKCINTTEPKAIKKGWEKTSLTEGFSLDEQLMDKDAEEEFLLRVALNELKLSETDDLIVENESESVGDNDVEEIEPEKAHEEKKQKQSQITDFFRTQK